MTFNVQYDFTLTALVVEGSFYRTKTIPPVLQRSYTFHAFWTSNQDHPPIPVDGSTLWLSAVC